MRQLLLLEATKSIIPNYSQDILKLSTSKEIMRALAEHRELWDEDLSNHLRRVKQEENKIRFSVLKGESINGV